MVFGLSGSNSRQQSSSESQASSYGYSGSTSRSFSTQYGRSLSGSEALGTSTQSLAYQPIFEALFGNAQSATAEAASNIPAIISASNRLFNTGQGFLSDLESGGAGADYLTNRLSGNNGIADAQVEQLGADIGRFLETGIEPAITERGVRAGTFGGSATGVARGEAARAALEEFSRGATSIRAGDQASRDAAASTLLGSVGSRASAGLAGLPVVQDVLRTGAFSGLDPYAALSSIIGPQTVLTQSQQESSSFGESLSEALSQALADAFGEDFAQSSSSSQSSGTSRSFGLSFGG